MFWGVSRLILTTSGATSPMFLEYFGGSPDYFQWLSEQLYQCFSNILVGPQTISNDFQSNYANLSQMFGRVPRRFSMISRSTISMLFQYFGGSPDYFWWLPERLYQCFPSVLVGLQTISGDYPWKYTHVAQVFCGAGGTSIAHCHLFGKECS
jgi:hypothetical protein